MDRITSILVTVGIPVVALIGLMVLVGLIFARLYKRATRETTLLRTGAGGRKVIIDGGCLVVPMLHELTKVNMRTLQISVGRKGEEAMITRDRLRVDSRVEFFVRVEASEDAI